MAICNFVGRIRVGGKVSIVTVPKAFISANIMKEGKRYMFLVKEVDNGTDSETDMD